MEKCVGRALGVTIQGLSSQKVTSQLYESVEFFDQPKDYDRYCAYWSYFICIYSLLLNDAVNYQKYVAWMIGDSISVGLWWIDSDWENAKSSKENLFQCHIL